MQPIKKTVFFGLLLVISVSIVLKENLFAMTTRKTIMIATVEYPPSFHKDGTGIAANMLTELFDKIGYDIEIKIYPLGRAIHMVNGGDIECAFLFLQTDKKSTISIPIYYSSMVFLYKKSRFQNGLNFNTLSDLKKYNIGALANSNFTIKLLQENAGLKLDFARSNNINLKKLDEGRIDLLPLSHLIAISSIESVFPGRKEEFGFSNPIAITPVCLIFSTKYPRNKNIIDDLRRKLNEIDMGTILQKHFGKYFQEGIIPYYMVTGEINK